MVFWDVVLAIFIWRVFFHESEGPDYDRIRSIIKEELKKKENKK